jgi:hypothetical protein
MRGCYDGGEQERTIAKQYRELAEPISDHHTRVAAMLKSIAESYQWGAKREDEQAQLGERCKRPAAPAYLAAFHGRSSSTRVILPSGMRAKVSASQAGGSMPLSLAVSIRV